MIRPRAPGSPCRSVTTPRANPAAAVVILDDSSYRPGREAPLRDAISQMSSAWDARDFSRSSRSRLAA